MFHLRDIEGKQKKMRKMCYCRFQKTAIQFLQALRQVNLPKRSDYSHKERNDSLGKLAELAEFGRINRSMRVC